VTLRFGIAGGGTGGHVTLALALGEVIRERGDDVIFLGGQQGFESQLVPEAGFELVTLASGQVVGRGLVGSARGALSIVAGVPAARRALRGAQIVISVGGYAAMPAVIACALAGPPLALLEPNAIPGRVNRLAARFAQRLFVGFDETAEHLAAPPERVRCVGIPLRQALRERFAAFEARSLPEAPFRLFVFGGSQGARQINEAMIAALPELAGLSLEIVHQTGEADRERVRAAYAESGVRADVVAFERDMPARYQWAHLAVCRAGAITVAELALARLPALLVPYPYAADDHQAANAAALERVGAGRALDAKTLDGAILAGAIRELLARPAGLSEMSAAAGSLSQPDAAHQVIEECVRLVAKA
jgi:UDP-N-acetylglucosamine--N-acetylmuramyl-(pentapeptide) pyrophosphoryl-undecaprenol N-acetylglucosamine transferase